MFIRRAVVPLLLLLTALPAAAQREPISDEPVPPRWVIVPRVMLGSYGDLWGDDETRPKLGASNGLAFGLALQFDPDGSLSYELAGSFSSPEYDFNPPAESDLVPIFGVGSLHLFRIAGSVFYRVRQNVPGYFILGAGALYYQPSERPSVAGSPLAYDHAQWMPSAHIGMGYDLTREGHTLQLGGRLYATRPSQSELLVPFLNEPLDAAIAWDVRISIGYRVEM